MEADGSARIAWFGASELAGLRLADDSYVSLITRVLADPGSEGPKLPRNPRG